MDPSITGAAYSMGPLSQFAVTYRDLAPLHDEPFMIYPHFVLNTIYRQPIKKKSIQIKKKISQEFVITILSWSSKLAFLRPHIQIVAIIFPQYFCLLLFLDHYSMRTNGTYSIDLLINSLWLVLLLVSAQFEWLATSIQLPLMALNLPSPAQVKPLFFSDTLNSNTSTKLPGWLIILSSLLSLSHIYTLLVMISIWLINETTITIRASSFPQHSC